MLHKFKHALVTLRFSILSIFITLFLLTSSAILIVRSIIFVDEVQYTSFTIMQYASNAVLKELVTGVLPVEDQINFIANLRHDGILKYDETDLLPYTYQLVKSNPFIRSVFIANESGNFVISRKDENEQFVSEIINKQNDKPNFHKVFYWDKEGHVKNQLNSPDLEYDHRVRAWYQQAKQAKKFIWSEIYLTQSKTVMGITAALPVFNERGEFKGVIGATISLDYLKNFVSSQKISATGYSFIIKKDGNLVAYPEQATFKVTQSNVRLVNVHDISLPLIDESLKQYVKTGQEEFTLKFNDKIYLINYRPIPKLSAQGWLIGVIAPQDDFVGFLKRLNYITFAISLAILALGIYIISKLVSRIVHPIHLLVDETEKVKRFELDTAVPIKTRIKEVFLLTHAIRSMKKGLKQFQRYVPTTLVKQLIESGQEMEIGGQRKTIAILFSDIENFTTIVEAHDAGQMMLQMCEYFEALSQIIAKEKGTIDKYIGDSIMVFWGAPLPEEHPSERAARTALLCQQKLKQLNQQWLHENKPQLITRIGIHIGEAIVGNLGSSERLSYTALGDTINIASRLENMNKAYQTKIIVSEAVYEQIKDNFILRKIDQVKLAGRVKPLVIYELIAEK
jgi:adenylate cyclase